jgi:hypothetical protein
MKPERKKSRAKETCGVGSDAGDGGEPGGWPVVPGVPALLPGGGGLGAAGAYLMV